MPPNEAETSRQEKGEGAGVSLFKEVFSVLLSGSCPWQSVTFHPIA